MNNEKVATLWFVKKNMGKIRLTFIILQTKQMHKKTKAHPSYNTNNPTFECKQIEF